MFNSLMRWLSDEIDQRGLGAVLGTAVGLLAAAGAVEVLVGKAVVRAAVVAAVVLVVTVLLVGSWRAFKGVASHSVKVSRLLENYVDVLDRTAALKWKAVSWRQSVDIDKRGNASIIRRMRLAPLDKPMHFVKLRLASEWAAPSTRLKRTVTAEVYEIDDEGRRGARYETTAWWTGNDSTREVTVHFSEEVPPGREIELEAQWTWPLYSRRLAGGECEEFWIVARHPMIVAEHSVTLETDGNKRPRYTPIGGTICSEDATQSGKWTVSFKVNEPENGQKYGVRVDPR